MQYFQLNQEAKLYKETEEINPAKDVRLSENGLASLKEATLTCKDETRAERYCHFSITIDTKVTIHDTE